MTDSKQNWHLIHINSEIRYINAMCEICDTLSDDEPDRDEEGDCCLSLQMVDASSRPSIEDYH
jgi:hypothetical protein